MSVSDIEEEMREIYEIELSTSAISIITNKVNQAAQECTAPQKLDTKLLGCFYEVQLRTKAYYR